MTKKKSVIEEGVVYRKKQAMNRVCIRNSKELCMNTQCINWKPVKIMLDKPSEISLYSKCSQPSCYEYDSSIYCDECNCIFGMCTLKTSERL